MDEKISEFQIKLFRLWKLHESYAGQMNIIPHLELSYVTTKHQWGRKDLKLANKYIRSSNEQT